MPGPFVRGGSYVPEEEPVTDLQSPIFEYGETDNATRALVHRLRMLHKISSATASGDAKPVERALDFALEELELEQAYLGAIDEDAGELVMQTVVARGRRPSYGPGKRYPMAQTLIGRVIESQTVLAAPDVERTRRENGIDYADEWKSYIATAIRFGGRQYGIIGFKGRAIRPRPFSQIDVEFVQITGDLIAAAVDRDLRYERLDALAFYDALTGLPNRVLLGDRLTQCILSANRRESSFAVLFLDLDGFKSINDRLGHAAGDGVLQRIAKRLARVAREGDTVARLGGDEFVVVAPHIETARDAFDLAKRFTLAIGRPITLGDRAFILSASIGISLFPDNGRECAELLTRADAAMFEAKSNGKNGIRFAAPDIGATSV